MKNFQGIHEAPPVIERSFKAATKLKFELPTDKRWKLTPMKLLSLAEDIHAKT